MNVTHPVPQGFRILDTLPAPIPPEHVLAEVRALWEAELAQRPDLFNGRIFSLDHLEGGEAVGFMAEYMWYVAQLRKPVLFEHLRVQSLAVSGLVVAGGHVLFGLRKAHLAVESGLWELAPSGTIHGDLRGADGSLSWRETFREELREELGIDAPADAPKAFALVEDTDTHIWELGVAVELALDHREVLAAWASLTRSEHSEMAAVPLADVPRFFTLRKADMVGACGPLLRAYGLIPA
jgi:hypothetical protein